ncbi:MULTISPECIES: PAS domain-containing sensor histidine kinase [Bacillaceae]|uniref:PAS domain-containing sensor histidine kinase n=1 Tax=Bacillaceae TaxID=186817 RepID=UPI001E35CEA4|nr:PAS domain-containing sensor histidine kinase [Bacillus sp. Au-Bac7]MCE4048494.1 ATP-binding protein [Bacillus sp. Au-Bac7]
MIVKKLLIYITVAIFPFLLAAGILLFTKEKEEVAKHERNAYRIASVHQRQWDNFINKTINSLNTVSIMLESSSGNWDKAKQNIFLKKLLLQEQMYGGIYILDPAGNRIAGTDRKIEEMAIPQEDYVKEAIKAKIATVSNKTDYLVDGQKVIGLAKPVLDDQQHVVNLIIAYLRVDYLSNVMEMLTPKSNIAVISEEKETILSMNKPISLSSSTIALPMNSLPWKIIVEQKEIKTEKILTKNWPLLLIFFICFHLLYFVIILYHHKKKADQENKENELHKLELVGNMAASSAHEIRNPLTGIKGLVQLLSEKHKDAEDQFYFSIIQKEINRINEIVSQFLILGKPTELKKQLLNIENIVTELKPLILSEANLYNVECHFEIAKKKLFVYCNADQMKQVILNITKNALEAMENGGTLTIKLKELNNRVSITVYDTGVGIPETELKKLFEPFYTSKSSGTGLGLVVCRRIIQSFNGEIYLSSVENKGTKVDIILPLNS